MFDGVVLSGLGLFFWLMVKTMVSAYITPADAMLAPPSRLFALDCHRHEKAALYMDMKTSNAGTTEATAATDTHV